MEILTNKSDYFDDGYLGRGHGLDNGEGWGDGEGNGSGDNCGNGYGSGDGDGTGDSYGCGNGNGNIEHPSINPYMHYFI